MRKRLLEILPIRWRKVFRDLTSNPSRTILVVLSIAVGVFATGMILGPREMLLREFDSDYALSDRPSIAMTTSNTTQSVVDLIAERSDVVRVNGSRIMSGRIKVRDEVSKGDAQTPWQNLELYAMWDPDEPPRRIFNVDSTSWPIAPGYIALEYGAAHLYKFDYGQEIEVETSSGVVKLKFAGWVHDLNSVPARFAPLVTGYISPETLTMLEEPKLYNTISIDVPEHYTRAMAGQVALSVRDDVLAPAGVRTLRTAVPIPGKHFLGDIFKGISVLLLLMAIMSLLLSGFLVVTTTSAILVQQTRQLGIMKAIGAQKWQIGRMYVGLIALYGLLGIIVGMPLGLIAGIRFVNYAAEILNFRILSYKYPVWVLFVLVAIGILVPILAAAFPITAGVRRSIVTAFSATSSGATHFGHGYIDRLLARITGLPRQTALALRSTFAQKGRLIMTLATLILASGVVMAVFSVNASLNKTSMNIQTWWDYDGQVMLSKPAPAQELEAIAKSIDGVRQVETWMDGRSVIEREDGTTNEEYFTLGYSPDSKMLRFNYASGGPFLEDEPSVIITTDLGLDEPDLEVGKMVRVMINGEIVERKIAGIVSTSLAGPYMYFTSDDLSTLMGVPGSATRVAIKGKPGMSSEEQVEVTKELEDALKDRNFSTSAFETSVEQINTVKSQLGILTNVLVIMASALAVVGIIGLAGSMTLSVIESTREIGIMRSIGASHASIFKIYITQGLVTGTLAWFGGFLISAPLSKLLINALQTAMGMDLASEFSWWGVLITFIIVWVISIFGSLLPSWRASMISIRDAISTE